MLMAQCKTMKSSASAMELPVLHYAVRIDNINIMSMAQCKTVKSSASAMELPVLHYAIRIDNYWCFTSFLDT